MIINSRLLRQYPPFICRIMARRISAPGSGGVHPIRSAEIARDSGLTLMRVLRIEKMSDWDEVRIDEAIRFIRACGLENQKPWRMRSYLERATGTRNGLHHLELLPVKERRRIARTFGQSVAKWRDSWRNLDSPP